MLSVYMDNLCKTHKMFMRAAVTGLACSKGSADTLPSIQEKYLALAKQVMRNEYGTRWYVMVEFNDETAQEFSGLQSIAHNYAEQEFANLAPMLKS